MTLAHQKYFPALRGLDAVSAMSAHGGGHYRSGNDRWGTPASIVEAARKCMGGIDLDPASEPIANETVKAARYFTLEDDGLAQHWSGRVFMNPPYSESGQKHRFIEKMEWHYLRGEVTQAVMVVSAGIQHAWGEPIRRSATGLCIYAMNANTRWHDLSNKQRPTSGVPGIIIYFGAHVDRFYDAFQHLGLVVRPIRPATPIKES